MENLLAEGLCSVGLLYLMLHLWRSISMIGQGVRPSRVPRMEDISEPSELPGPKSALSGKPVQERGDWF
jgi:hypothetical protein